MVEHDREVIAGADQLLDFGPGAGEFGGQIVARGTPAASCQIARLGHRSVSQRQESDSGADEPQGAGVDKRQASRRLSRRAKRKATSHGAQPPALRVPAGS